MPKKPAIKVVPEDLTYIDESKLDTKTEDEAWQDEYDMGFRPADFACNPKSQAEFEDFIKRMGYEL